MLYPYTAKRDAWDFTSLILKPHGLGMDFPISFWSSMDTILCLKREKYVQCEAIHTNNHWWLESVFKMFPKFSLRNQETEIKKRTKARESWIWVIWLLSGSLSTPGHLCDFIKQGAIHFPIFSNHKSSNIHHIVILNIKENLREW